MATKKKGLVKNRWNSTSASMGKKRKRTLDNEKRKAVGKLTIEM